MSGALNGWALGFFLRVKLRLDLYTTRRAAMKWSRHYNSITLLPSQPYPSHRFS